MTHNIAQNYKDTVHNTLAKVVAIDLVNAVNALPGKQDASPREAALLTELKNANLDSIAIQGSAFHCFVRKPVPYPRNIDDLDVFPVCYKKFDNTRIWHASRHLFEYAAETIGASFKGAGREERSQSRVAGRVAHWIKKQDKNYITVEFTPERLDEVLKHGDRYRLSDADRKVIQGLMAVGNAVPVTLMVHTVSVSPHPDLPVLDFDGNEKPLSHDGFQGMTICNFLEQAMLKVAAINRAWRDSPNDASDIFNCMTLAGRPDGKFTDEDIATFNRSMFKAGSTFQTINFLWGVANGDMYRALHARPALLFNEPDDQACEDFKKKCEFLVEKNILPRMYTTEEIRSMLQAAHHNSCKTLKTAEYRLFAELPEMPQGKGAGI